VLCGWIFSCSCSGCSDAGATWQPFSVTQGITNLALDEVALPPGEDLCVRVVAADGLDAAIATSAQRVTRTGSVVNGSCTGPAPGLRYSLVWVGLAAVAAALVVVRRAIRADRRAPLAGPAAGWVSTTEG
jgi:hypothetical protein